MYSECNPFRLDKKQRVIKFQKQSYVNVDREVAICGHFVALKIHQQDHDRIVIINNQSRQVASQRLASPTTNMRIANQQILLVCSIAQKSLKIYDGKTNSFSSIQIPKLDASSQVQIQYFQPFRRICLIETITNGIQVRVHNLQFYLQDNQIDIENVVETKQQKKMPYQTILKADNMGSVLCCSKMQQQMKITLITNDGYVYNWTINAKQLLGQGVFKPCYAQIRGDDIILVVLRMNNQSFQKGYFPIINIQTKQFQQIENVEFMKTSQIRSKELFEQCVDLKDFILLKNKDIGQEKPCAFSLIDKHSLQIVLKSQSFSTCCHQYPNIIHFYSQNTDKYDRIDISTTKVFRKTLVSFDKIMQTEFDITELAKIRQNAILICGSSQSGKSTFRHFLAGHQLIHENNVQYDFYELKSTIREDQAYQNQPDRNKIVWLSDCQKHKAVILDLPDLTQPDPFFSQQIYLLLAKIFKSFKYLHFIMTVPQEYLQDSFHNFTSFNSVLALLDKQRQKVQYSISIVLTKIDSPGQALQTFQEHIEQIMEVDSTVGHLVTQINEQQRILIFENIAYNVEESKEMIEKILSRTGSELSQRPKLTVQLMAQQNMVPKMRFTYEVIFSLEKMNILLHFLVHHMTQMGTSFNQNRLTCYFNQSEQLLPDKALIEQDSFKTKIFELLAHLKKILITPKLALLEEFTRLVKNLVLSIDQSNNIFSNILRKQLKVIAGLFDYILAYSLHTSYFQLQFWMGAFYMGDQGVVGENQFRRIMQKFGQVETIRSSPQYKQLCSELGIQQVGRTIKKYLPMTYQQQRKSILLKKQKRLQTIINLPSNALKLDLMLIQLFSYIYKVELNNQQTREVNFYLHQCSKICDFHHMHVQSIIFLMVIPDFNGIDCVLDLLLQHAQKRAPLKQKSFFTEQQNAIIKYLIKFSRQYCRDNLIRKLAKIEGLRVGHQKQISQAARAQQQNILKNNLSREEFFEAYEKRLNSDEKLFYNMDNDNFTKILKNKDDLVNRCRQWEKQNKEQFSNLEAMQYLLQSQKIPAS